MDRATGSRTSRLLSAAAAVSIIALGLVVIAAWHLHLPALIQVQPGYAPMQYNSALGFLAAGVALLGALYSRRRWPAFAAAVAFLLGVLTLTEYLTGIDLHIDHLFMRPYIVADPSAPGRIAPNSALAFVTAGAAVWLACTKRGRFRQAPVVAMLGAIVTAIGLAAAIGYARGIEGAYVWSEFKGMGIHTAYGFTLLGVGITAQAWNAAGGSSMLSRRWLLPLPVVVGGAVVVLLMSRALVTETHRRVQRICDTHTDNVRDRVSMLIMDKARDLQTLVRRPSAAPPGTAPCRSDFEELARERLAPAGLARLGRDGRVLCSTGTIPGDATAAATAPLDADGIAIISAPDDPGSLLLVATARDRVGRAETLIASFALSALLQSLPGEPSQYFELCVTKGATPVGCVKAESGETMRAFLEERALRPASLGLSIQTAPTLALLERSDSPLPGIVLAGGLVIVTLLGFSLYLAVAARSHARTLQTYQEKLRSLAEQVSRAEEGERRRIASALHDGTIQSLGLARLKLCQLRAAEPNAAAAMLDDAIAHIERTTRDTRSLVFDFSPPVLYELGLPAALEWLAERTQAQYGFACEVSASGEDAPLAPAIAVVLFRCVSEILTNVHKHAGANHVALAFRRNNAAVTIRVRDDGSGLDMQALDRLPREGGFGLFSIRERINSLGGDFQIQSIPGGGTTVTLTVPVNATVEVRA